MDSEVITGAALRRRIVDGAAPLLARVLGGPQPVVSEHTGLRDELGMSSATVLELMLEFEEEFGIEIQVEALDETHAVSLGGLADFVVAHARPAG